MGVLLDWTRAAYYQPRSAPSSFPLRGSSVGKYDLALFPSMNASSRERNYSNRSRRLLSVSGFRLFSFEKRRTVGLDVGLDVGFDVGFTFVRHSRCGVVNEIALVADSCCCPQPTQRGQ